MKIESKSVHKKNVLSLFCLLLSLSSCEFQTGEVKQMNSVAIRQESLPNPSDTEEPKISVEAISVEDFTVDYGEHYRKVVIQADRTFIAHQIFQIKNESSHEIEIKVRPLSEVSYLVTLDQSSVYKGENNSIAGSTCSPTGGIPASQSAQSIPLQSDGKMVLINSDWFIHQQNLNQGIETSATLPAQGQTKLVLYYLSSKEWNEIDPGMVYQRTTREVMQTEQINWAVHCALVHYRTEVSKLSFPKAVWNDAQGSGNIIFKKFKSNQTWFPELHFAYQAILSNP